MARLKRPSGLIRYESQNALAGRTTRWVRPRTILYLGLLFVGASVAAWAISTIRPANFFITRMTGAPYIVDAASVRNQFFVRVVNKRNTPVRFVLALPGAPAGLRQSGFSGAVEVPALGEIATPLVLQQPRSAYAGPFPFTVRLEDERGSFHLERAVEFLGPEPRLLRNGETAP
jgi:polyferredoxin